MFVLPLEVKGEVQESSNPGMLVSSRVSSSLASSEAPVMSISGTTNKRLRAQHRCRTIPVRSPRRLTYPGMYWYPEGYHSGWGPVMYATL